MSALFFCGTILFTNQLFAKCDSTIYADEIFALNETKDTQHHGKIIAWTYSGNIFLLDENLCLIREIKIPHVSISDVKQHAGSLYAVATKTAKNSEIESEIIQYDIANGKRKQRWSDPEYYIWSLSVDENKVVAISSQGDLLGLGVNGFEPGDKYQRNSHYFPVSGAEPIICTAPNLTKLNWKSASCYRKGKFAWRTDGGWRNMSPPFLCHNYLIEKNVESGENEGNVAVINISNGHKIIAYKANDISALTCIDTGIAYASESLIVIHNLPDLKKIYTVPTDSNAINAIAKIGNLMFYVDDMRKIHKCILKD